MPPYLNYLTGVQGLALALFAWMDAHISAACWTERLNRFSVSRCRSIFCFLLHHILAPTLVRKMIHVPSRLYYAAQSATTERYVRSVYACKNCNAFEQTQSTRVQRSSCGPTDCRSDSTTLPTLSVKAKQLLALHLRRGNNTRFSSRLWRATDGEKLHKINYIVHTLVMAFLTRYLSILNC